MSYCRWSSDDFSSDLYCYADVSGGYTTHVATNRVVGTVPAQDWSLLDKGEEGQRELIRQHRAQMEFMKTAERAPIGPPHDGETFNDPTLEAFRDRLLALRAVGYRFPDDVLPAVEAEIAAQSEERA